MGRPVSHTGLLTARCDPYGAESRIKLLGGIYPESHVGRIMWHCDRAAEARYRMQCRGGDYGTRMAPGGPVTGYSCPGGHRGQVMALCSEHRREIAKRQAGLCPACAYPPGARAIAAELEQCQRALTSVEAIWDFKRAAQLAGRMDDLQAAMTELRDRGAIHQCPLELVEVS